MLLLFLEKVLAGTQTVIKLCSFDKGITFQCSTQLVESLVLLFYFLWTHPAEFSTTRGSECHAELGLLEHISREAFVLESNGWVLSFVATSWGVFSISRVQLVLFPQWETHLTYLSESWGPCHAELSLAWGSDVCSERRSLVYAPLGDHCTVSGRSACPPPTGFLVPPTMGDCLEWPSKVPVGLPS